MAFVYQQPRTREQMADHKGEENNLAH